MLKKILHFDQLPESEQEDFVATCTKYGFRPDEFKVLMKEEYQSVGVAPLLKEASVTRINNGKAKSYPSGGGTAWIVAFENDLRSANFN